jgi:hypothetical protein
MNGSIDLRAGTACAEFGAVSVQIPGCEKLSDLWME